MSISWPLPHDKKNLLSIITAINQRGQKILSDIALVEDQQFDHNLVTISKLVTFKQKGL